MSAVTPFYSDTFAIAPSDSSQLLATMERLRDGTGTPADRDVISELRGRTYSEAVHIVALRREVQAGRGSPGDQEFLDMVDRGILPKTAEAVAYPTPLERIS